MKKCKALLTVLFLVLIAAALFACTPQVTLTHVPAASASCGAEGNVEYWYDAQNGKYYRDAEGKVEVSAEAVKIPTIAHSYGDWKIGKNPTTSRAGTLVRTCKNDASHTEVYNVPLLDEKNGYRLTYSWGDVKGEKPTFTEEGHGFFVWKRGNQTFMFEEYFEPLNDYYDRRDDVTLFTIDDYTYTGATLNSAKKTLVVNANTGKVSFTVNAAKEGFYTLYLQYCTEGSKATQITVKNKTYTEWTAHNAATLAESSKNSSKTYLIPDYEIDKDFPASPAVIVYLKKGANELEMSFSDKIGISRALLVEQQVFADDATKVVLPYTGVDDSANGVLIEEDTSGSAFQFTVPQDGTYTLYASLSTSGSRVLFESVSNSFPTLAADIPQRQSGNTTQNRFASTYLYEIGELQLSAGTHSARFTLKSTDNQLSEYLHYNLLVLERKSDKAEVKPTLDILKKVNEATHSLDLSVSVSGVTPSGSPNMKVIVSGYYTHTDGTETPFAQEFQKASYNQTFTYTTNALTGNMDGVTYTVSLYDGDVLLHKEKISHYSIDDTLTIFMMSDTHYVGPNITQDIRNYKYDETHAYGWGTRSLKGCNSYRTSYEAWGWSSDEKMTRLIDDIIQRYEAGEFDIVFFLGDQAMGDGNYYNFASDHVMYSNQSHYGRGLFDYWDHPLNNNFIYEKQFMDRLAAAGVPYFCSFGNHETLMEYNENKTDVSYEQWEIEYHYQELFGHKNADGTIYDASPNNYFIRVIRRNGEMKILSALSSSELEAFKARQAGDGNCYDYFVSEDSLTADDIELGSILATHTYQIGSYDNYMIKYVFGIDPYTGEVDKNIRDYNGQTIRTEYVSRDVLEAMEPMFAEAKNIYMVSHNSSDVNHLFSDLFHKYPQFQATFIGDVHDETYAVNIGLVPRWVVGCFSQAYDVDFYYTYDENGNQLGNDNQYYYYKNGRVGNSIGGDYRYHSFSYVMLHIKGNEAYVERERIGFFYKNTEPEFELLVDRVTGWDPDYTRAVDYTREPGESFTVGNRTLFVGGDCFILGSTHLNIAKDYTRGAYNPAEYVLYPTETSSVYTVCDLSGRALNADGKPVVVNGGTAVTVTLTATKEGTTLTLNGETYYIVSTVGGVVGHYLYDENGDFVYVDKNGDYVFYDFYTDENGEYVKEYFYEKEDGSFVALGEWNADHTKYTLKDGIYTDMWLNGDPMTVSRLDSSTNDSELLHKVTVQYSTGKYRVESGTIEIKNGIVMRGLGFMNYGYAYRFVDANGNEVNKADVQQNLTHTYTYSLKNPAGYTLGQSLGSQDFNIKDNGLTTTFGFYQPRMKYNKSWIDR